MEPVALRIRSLVHDTPLGRWRYSVMPPRPDLADAVECIWEVVGTQSYNREKILPNGRVELLFNLGAPHWLHEGGERRAYRDAWVSGLQERYLVIESPGRGAMMGARLRPLGAHRFFRLPMRELAGAIVDLDAVLGAWITAVTSRLRETASTAGRFMILERLLTERLAAAPAPDPGVAWAWSEIEGRDGKVRIEDLRAELRVSRKRLVDRFRQTVGLPPKALARIRRFHALAEALRPARRIDWAELALDHGYYDQSHLARDFHAFAGVTPRELVAGRVPDGGLLA